MLCGVFVVKQATVLHGFAFDPFSFQQDGLASPEVDVGRGEIIDALVIAPVVVVRDERIDLSFEIARQIIRPGDRCVAHYLNAFCILMFICLAHVIGGFAGYSLLV